MTTEPLAHDLIQTFDPDAGALQTLRDTLVDAAQREGVLDVGYRTVDSPVGLLLVAATDRGVVRLAFPGEDHAAVLQSLADQVSPRVLEAPARLDPVARELDEYFAGRRQAFDVPLDWQLSAGFRRTVLHELATIGYGRTATYAAVAARAGSPRAVRAVGSACATNPLPLLVPCHRVVRSDGGLGGYLGGLEAKRTLLDFEAG